MSTLHLSLLGPPEVRVDARVVTFPTRKALALLAYLALEPGSHPRELLALLLWPEASSERSYGSLRNTFSRLQTALREPGDRSPSPHLASTHLALAIGADADLILDLQIVEHAYALARAERSSRTSANPSTSLPALLAAMDCYRGDFLAGFSLGDAPAFDDWVGSQREAWRRRMGLILDRLSEIQYANGDLAQAAETAARWIVHDGLNEVAYRRKMRAHFAAGERGQALDTFEACRALLQTELHVAPEPDTQALADRIRAPHPGSISPIPDGDPSPTATTTAVTYLESVFAGRDVERRLLDHHYQSAVNGVPQVVVLRGEAGIGKSRLAHAFMSSVAVDGACVLQGGAFESGSHIPFQPWVEALRGALERGLIDRLTVKQTGWGALAQLVPDWPGREPDGLTKEDAHGRAAASTEHRHIFEALASLTQSLSEQSPLVILLDDLQWADGATLDTVSYAVRYWRAAAAHILVLIGIRAEALVPSVPPQPVDLSLWLSQLAHDAEVSQVELEPLSEDDTLRMVGSLLASPSPDFAQWIFNETHGHPFYLMETLKDLLERGALHPQRTTHGQWLFAVDHAHDLGQAVRVPSTVRFVIRSRLARLSPGAFNLLAAGTILDHGLTFDRLCAVANLTPDLGLPALDEILSARLLREVGQLGRASVYAFANDMIRDVAYTEAGDARRRLFHKRALETLEVEQDSAAMLAHHALAAGAVSAALAHSLAAGEEALRVSATHEARAHLDNARRLVQEAALAGAENEARLRDLYAQLGQAFELIDDPAQAAEAYADRGRLSSNRPRS